MIHPKNYVFLLIIATTSDSSDVYIAFSTVEFNGTPNIVIGFSCNSFSNLNEITSRTAVDSCKISTHLSFPYS